MPMASILVRRKQSTLVELVASPRSAADFRGRLIAQGSQAARGARAILAMCNLAEVIANELAH